MMTFTRADAGRLRSLLAGALGYSLTARTSSRLDRALLWIPPFGTILYALIGIRWATDQYRLGALLSPDYELQVLETLFLTSGGFIVTTCSWMCGLIHFERSLDRLDSLRLSAYSVPKFQVESAGFVLFRFVAALVVYDALVTFTLVDCEQSRSQHGLGTPQLFVLFQALAMPIGSVVLGVVFSSCLCNAERSAIVSLVGSIVLSLASLAGSIWIAFGSPYYLNCLPSSWWPWHAVEEVGIVVTIAAIGAFAAMRNQY